MRDRLVADGDATGLSLRFITSGENLQFTAALTLTFFTNEVVMMVIYLIASKTIDRLNNDTS